MIKTAVKRLCQLLRTSSDGIFLNVLSKTCIAAWKAWASDFEQKRHCEGSTAFLCHDFKLAFELCYDWSDCISGLFLEKLECAVVTSPGSFPYLQFCSYHAVALMATCISIVYYKPVEFVA